MQNINNEKSEISENQDGVPPKKKSFLDSVVDILFGKKNSSPNTAGIPANNKVDVNRYQDSEGLTVFRMEFGLWLVEHRKKLIMIPVVFLIVFSAVTWGYTIVGLFYYVIWGMPADDKLAYELTSANLNIIRADIQELIIEPVQVIQNDNNRYDLAVKVKNPNKKHWAEIEYYFAEDSVEFGHEKNFILPEEEKYLLALNLEFSKLPSAIRFFLNNTQWNFINPHKYPDWGKFKVERLDIKITDAVFIPAKSTILSEKLNLNEVKFTAVNNTAFNYYEVGFNVTLFNRGKLVGAGKYSLSNFLAGESRQINLTWQGRISQVDEIKVTPEIKITDDSIYMKFKGDETSGQLDLREESKDV